MNNQTKNTLNYHTDERDKEFIIPYDGKNTMKILFKVLSIFLILFYLIVVMITQNWMDSLEILLGFYLIPTTIIYLVGWIYMSDKSGAIVLNKDGVFERRFNKMHLKTKWENIVGINLKMVIEIHVNNQNELIRNTNILKRIVRKQNVKYYGTSITLSANGYSLSGEEIVAILYRTANQYNAPLDLHKASPNPPF